ncbi:MAG: hypothetical protein JST55_03365 [Bacteroidetes bacterium]|nr:hypothetical protein [Bacteroidota bacterium]
MAHLEFEAVTNSNRYVVIKLGSETILFDLLAVRLGYYVGNTYVYKLASDFTPFTYGFGLKIPLDKIFRTKFPLSVSADYVHLNQQPEWDYYWHEYFYKYDYYKTFSINLNWSPSF